MWTKLALFTAFISVPALGCNQRIYDEIYRRITIDAITRTDLKKDNIREVALERMQEIEALRELCNGQLSTFERGTK